MQKRDSTEATRAFVQALYEAYAVGDIERAAAGISEDVDWAILAPRYLFDFAGPRRGRAGVIEAFREIARGYEFLAYEPKMLVVDAGQAAVYIRAQIRDRATQRTVDLELCDIMRIEDGRVVWFREFVDSVTAAVALYGGPEPA